MLAVQCLTDSRVLATSNSPGNLQSENDIIACWKRCLIWYLIWYLRKNYVQHAWPGLEIMSNAQEHFASIANSILSYKWLKDARWHCHHMNVSICQLAQCLQYTEAHVHASIKDDMQPAGHTWPHTAFEKLPLSCKVLNGLLPDETAAKLLTVVTASSGIQACLFPIWPMLLVRMKKPACLGLCPAASLH